MTDGRLRMPARTHTRDGVPRRVGVEIEMSGIGLDEVAAIVADRLGLTVESKGRYERVLRGDAAGDWQVEFDFHLLKELGREPRDDRTLSGELRGTAEEALKRLSEPIVPVELVSPPLPFARLGEVESLIGALRAAGATGTADRVTNAFGMQLNAEAPALDHDTLRAYVQAFACLQDWLFTRSAVDLSRRATTYVDPYPERYVRRVVDPTYRPPSLAALIDDYLVDNPTRNRALDCLPLFAHCDDARVRAAVADPLVKARPAFHYRLPNSRVDEPGWGVYLAWNDWVEVEALADDPQRLAALGAAYAAFLDKPIKRWLGDWSRVVAERWLGR